MKKRFCKFSKENHDLRGPFSKNLNTGRLSFDLPCTLAIKFVRKNSIFVHSAENMRGVWSGVGKVPSRILHPSFFSVWGRGLGGSSPSPTSLRIPLSPPAGALHGVARCLAEAPLLGAIAAPWAAPGVWWPGPRARI